MSLLRVMLVDDEPMALEGLRLLINWRDEGFEICRECTSGLDALTQLETAEPDLIVTDIRMPGIDGIQLMREAKERGFDGQFVIVSGYSDFEYAQSALRLGVAGYLLKPIDPTEAGEVLEHVRRKLINRELDAAMRDAGYQRQLTAYLSDQPERLDLVPKGGSWLLATWGAPLHYDVLRAMLKPLESEQTSVHIIEDKEWLALHVPADHAEPSLASLRDTLAKQRREMRVARGVLTELPQMRRSLASALDDNREALRTRIDAMTRSISLRQTETFLRQADDLCDFCASCGAGSARIAKRIFLNECLAQLAGHSDAVAEFLSVQSDTIQQLGLMVIDRLAPSQERVSDRAIRYVRDRISERLTLENVADALGYNATYLGRVFREEQGEGFRDWLARVRVERAAHLLLDTNRSVIEIADEVGYPQYKRFLDHFKRYCHQTPEAYRKRL